jgi:hypothetical protein
LAARQLQRRAALRSGAAGGGAERGYNPNPNPNSSPNPNPNPNPNLKPDTNPSPNHSPGTGQVPRARHRRPTRYMYMAPPHLARWASPHPCPCPCPTLPLPLPLPLPTPPLPLPLPQPLPLPLPQPLPLTLALTQVDLAQISAGDVAASRQLQGVHADGASEEESEGDVSAAGGKGADPCRGHWKGAAWRPPPVAHRWSLLAGAWQGSALQRPPGFGLSSPGCWLRDAHGTSRP